MTLGQIEQYCLEQQPTLADHRLLARNAIRLGVGRLRPFRRALSAAERKRRFKALREQIRRDYEEQIRIDPLTLSILIKIIFHVAGLLLQWWQHRREAAGYEAASAELVAARQEGQGG
jgi:hypothetical protein